MTTTLVTSLLLLRVLLQVGGLPAGPMPDSLTPVEKSGLAAAANIERRIKIYTQASEDRLRSVERAVTEQKYDAITPILNAWREVLDFSLTDIEANAGQKSKSRALKNYEIQLRKALGAVSELKTRGGSYEQFEQFQAWLNHAGDVQKKIVAILFPG